MNDEFLKIEPEIREKEGVAVLDLEAFREMQKRLQEYAEKEETLRSLKKFEELSAWGEQFAKEQGITKEDVLRDD